MWRKFIVVGLLVALVTVSFGSFQAKPAAAQGGTTWQIFFYNNLFLFDPSVTNVTVPALNLNWGGNAPANGVNADGFTARAGGDPFFAAGNYRFFVLADDGVRVTIDHSNTIINTFDDPKPGQLLTADVTLGAGIHHIQVDYKELVGNAFLFLDWTNLASPVVPAFAANAVVPGSSSLGGNWAAQYYNNTSLSGSPAATLTEASPSHNWGANAPLAGVSADNFTARWTSVQTLAAGTYQISARADDGVRVIIDGTTHINQFPGVPGQTFNANVTLSAGQHTFVVEYLEGAGSAYLEFGFTPISLVPTNPTNPTTPITGASLRVNASVLNVRSQPSNSGQRLTTVRRNEVYPVLGQQNGWWQINVNGVIGWVFGRYVTTSNTQSVGGGTTAPAPTGNILTTTARVNVRSGPSTANNILTVMPNRSTASIVGRNGDTSWFQVNFNGVIGWVSAGFVTVASGVNIGALPVTG